MLPNGPTTPADGPHHVAWQLRDQARACQAMGSPLYARLLRRAASEVDAGGAAWLILEPHVAPGRGDAVALRFMAAVHRLVLTRQAAELAVFYPSVGGTAPTDDVAGDAAEEAFTDLLAARTAQLADLTARPCQTNEVGRAAGLLGGFLAVARAHRLSLRCLEVGASAGLNLRWDHFRYGGGGAWWGPVGSPVDLSGLWAVPPPVEPHLVEVAERRGCDVAPVDLGSADGRLGVTASLWADQEERFARLKGALAVAAQVPAEVDRAPAAAWAAARLAETAEGVATVVYHSVVSEYLPDAELTAFHLAVRDAGARATASAPLAWLRLEPVSALRAHGVALTTWPGGEERTVARCGAHGQDVEWLA